MKFCNFLTYNRAVSAIAPFLIPVSTRSEEVLTPEEIRTHPVVYLDGVIRWVDLCKKDFPEGTRFATLEYAHDQAITEVRAEPAAVPSSLNAQ